MEAYADRSYAPPLQLYAVASFLAPANDWARLQIRWRRILRAADPKLEFFHMVDFMSKKVSPYCDWDDEKREWVLNELIRAVCTSVTFGCAGVMTRDGYGALVDLHAARSAVGKTTIGNNPYEICADACVGYISQWLDGIGPGRRVAYFMESGDDGQGQYISAIGAILSKSKIYRDLFKVLSMTTVSKRDSPAVQTADILAYEVTHCRADQGEAAFTSVLARLSSRIPMKVVYIDCPTIELFTEEYTPEVIERALREHSLLAGVQRKRRRPRKRRGAR